MGPKDDKKDEVLNGFIRHLLTTLGGALVTKSYLGEAQLELTVGAGVFLGAFARVARAIFTLTMRVAALIGFFTHITVVWAFSCPHSGHSPTKPSGYFFLGLSRMFTRHRSRTKSKICVGVTILEIFR